MGAARLTPNMSSRKVQALDCIKRYFARWGYSPTLGEIAAELGVSAKRAHDLVRQLAVERMIEQVSGKARGIRLIERGEELGEADILVRLSQLGWTIGVAGQMVPPGDQPEPARELSAALLRTLSARSGQALTEKGLHSLPTLDHIESAAAPPHTNPGAPAGVGTEYHGDGQAAGAAAQGTRQAERDRAGDRRAEGG